MRGISPKQLKNLLKLISKEGGGKPRHLRQTVGGRARSGNPMSTSDIYKMDDVDALEDLVWKLENVLELAPFELVVGNIEGNALARSRNKDMISLINAARDRLRLLKSQAAMADEAFIGRMEDMGPPNAWGGWEW